MEEGDKFMRNMIIWFMLMMLVLALKLYLEKLNNGGIYNEYTGD